MSKRTITGTIEDMKAGRITPIILMRECLDAIALKDGNEASVGVHAFLETFKDAHDQSVQADREIEEARAKGPAALDELFARKPLLGIPVAVKDNILIEGRKASAASKILEEYVASYDATAIKKLKAAGALFIGRVNMDEFAMGGSTENSAYGVTRNPYDLSRVSGGSSGGSAAAVAMMGALAALGSDTGGSIRQPSSYCGVVGLKPTYGSVSRHGLMAMASSLDIIGPITQSVADAELILNVIQGEDGYDSTSFSQTSSTGAQVATSVANSSANADAGKPLTIGIVKELMNIGGIDPLVLQNFNESIEKLKATGCTIKEISLPNIKYSLAAYYVSMPAEVSSNMARFDGVKYGSKIEGDSLLEDYMKTRGQLLGREVRRRIILGTYVLSSGYYDAYYNKANLVREKIGQDFKEAFKEVDLVLTPTAPSPAFKIGKNSNDPIQMYLEDVFTVTANLIGIPAISVPSGMVDVQEQSAAGETVTVKLPLGLQFSADHNNEKMLFRAGKLLEQIQQQ